MRNVFVFNHGQSCYFATRTRIAELKPNSATYKEKQSPPASFRLPAGLWSDPQNYRKFLDWLGKRLAFNTIEDWYKLTKDDVVRYGGNGLLKRYPSVPQLVTSIYTEHQWLPWKFAQTDFWEKPNNIRQYFDWL